MKKIPELLLTLALATLPAAALAQRTPPTPSEMAQHQVERYTDILTLTSEQQAAALTLFTTEATAVEPLHQTERTLHTTLETAITNDDLGTIASTATQLGTINGQIEGYRANAQAGFYKLLTADQKTRFAALHHHGGPGMERGGFGPPPPPPGAE
jgi:Spy/CpxP family protein refolding chaperone